MDVDALSLCWEKALIHDLHVLPQTSGILSVTPTYMTKQGREDLTQIAFEQFNMSIFYVASAEICVAYATGRTSAVIVDLGADETSVTKVEEGS